MTEIYYTYGPYCGVKCIKNNEELWSIKNELMLTDEMIEQIKKLYGETYEPDNKYYIYRKTKNIDRKIKSDETIWMPSNNERIKKWLDIY